MSRVHLTIIYFLEEFNDHISLYKFDILDDAVILMSLYSQDVNRLMFIYVEIMRFLKCDSHANLILSFLTKLHNLYEMLINC